MPWNICPENTGLQRCESSPSPMSCRPTTDLVAGLAVSAKYCHTETTVESELPFTLPLFNNYHKNIG